MKYLGYCEENSLPIKQGDFVLIPKGTPYKNTHPQKKEGLFKKAVKVKVNHLLPGQELPAHEITYRERHGRNMSHLPRKTVQRSHGPEEVAIVSNPCVRYAGSGGYWVEVDINLVEKL